MTRLFVATLALGLSAFSAPQVPARMPFNSLKVGDREVTFNTTMTLARAIALLGKADTNNRGDAGTSLTWLCYRAVAGADTAVLAVESSEMGGGIYVTSFTLQRTGRDRSLERRCAPLAVAPRAIVTDRGITLGMTRAQVEHELGRPQRDTSGVAEYDWSPIRHGRFGNRDNVAYSEGSSLTIWYVDGVVVRIWGDRGNVS